MKPVRQFLENDADSYIRINPQNGEVKIADCTRSVTLWFYTSNDNYGCLQNVRDNRKVRSSLKKIDKLLKPLLQYKEFLEEELEDA